jgi:hypothetical protein
MRWLHGVSGKRSLSRSSFSRWVQSRIVNQEGLGGRIELGQHAHGLLDKLMERLETPARAWTMAYWTWRGSTACVQMRSLLGIVSHSQSHESSLAEWSIWLRML